ncbi:glycoside hydrolase family 32 protein [Helcococcus kunzii]|uniref:glycoside hydrolase family 32 protein n=1 Tax=Helcococcus kunzii TaxID=40091 RepID=UPI0024AD9426|nr:glycoside hydrolase family 32 protein [Helcococcus kunzii]
MSLIKKANNYIETNQGFVSDIFRPKFHFHPPIGWMNDPNGLIYFKGYYHVFYQYYPYDNKWNSMHWGHARSKDLVHWESLPVALAPDQEYDCDGCFSGSAIVVDDELVLMYTGVSKVNNLVNQVQCIASSKDGIVFEKYSNNPVIDQENLKNIGNTVDFRDPKVFKKYDKYYCVVASKKELNNDETVGLIYIFESEDFKSWSKASILIEGTKEYGTIWECPDLFELDGKDVLIISPMRVPENNGKFSNLNSVVYMIGKMDWENLKYECEFIEELDFGLDFYATQSFLDDSNNRIILSWLQTWNRTNVLSDMNNLWSGMLSLPRKINVEDNHIVQSIPENVMNQFNIKETSSISNDEYEFIAKNYNKFIFENEDNWKIYIGNSKDYSIVFEFNNNRLTIDRHLFGENIKGAEKNSNRRSVEMQSAGTIEIFLDKSSIELFINGVSISLTYYAHPQPTKIFVETSGNISVYSGNVIE